MMKFYDWVLLILATSAGILVSVGSIILALPDPSYKAAKFVFLLCAICFGMLGPIWVMSTKDHSNSIRFAASAGTLLPAIIAVACIFVFMREPDKSILNADFKPFFYGTVVGESGFGETNDGKIPILNPVVILVRFDNFGGKASSLSPITLKVSIGNDVFMGVKNIISAPLHLAKGYTISPESDLLKKITESIEPGHSVFGALLFTFPDVEPGRIRREEARRKFSISFTDIYSRDYEFIVKVDNGVDQPLRMPGIIYQ